MDQVKYNLDEGIEEGKYPPAHENFGNLELQKIAAKFANFSPFAGIIDALKKQQEELQHPILPTLFEQDSFDIVSSSPESLIELYPNKTKKSRIPRKILLLFIQKPTVSEFKISKCVTPRLTKRVFDRNRHAYKQKVLNCIKRLNKKLKTRNFLIRKRMGDYQLDNLSSLF